MTADLASPIRSIVEPSRAATRVVGPERSVQSTPAPVPPATPNPRLRLDAPLGMVVIEFRDSGGDVANTIPSPRQIAAYRAAAVSDAPVPVGVRAQPAPATEPALRPELPPPPAAPAEA